jgi:hypothetical protein
MVEFYAVRYNNGKYWTRPGSPTPALFTSEARARATVKAFGSGYGEYVIVIFTEKVI